MSNEAQDSSNPPPPPLNILDLPSFLLAKCMEYTGSDTNAALTCHAFFMDQRPESYAYLAARLGRLQVLQWLQDERRVDLRRVQQWRKWDNSNHIPPMIGAPSIGAAIGGHIDCMEYLIKMHYIERRERNTAFRVAARHGHLELLKHFIDKDTAMLTNLGSVLCAQAALGDHLECLQFLHEEAGCRWDITTCDNAAEGGSLGCLEYACEHGCKLHQTYARVKCSLYEAAKCGSLPCLRYLHETGGCELTKSAAEIAAREGHLDCLDYIVQNVESSRKCCFQTALFLAASQRKVCFETALREGRADRLKVILEKDVVMTTEPILDSATVTQCGCGGYLGDNSYLYPELRLCSVDRPKYLLFKHGVTMDDDPLVLEIAVKEGRNQCVRACMLKASEMVEVAAHLGHLECLRLLVGELGCDWRAISPRLASKNGHTECRDYLFQERSDRLGDRRLAYSNLYEAPHNEDLRIELRHRGIAFAETATFTTLRDALKAHEIKRLSADKDAKKKLASKEFQVLSIAYFIPCYLSKYCISYNGRGRLRGRRDRAVYQSPMHKWYEDKQIALLGDKSIALLP